jgi:hypothetical protein
LYAAFRPHRSTVALRSGASAAAFVFFFLSGMGSDLTPVSHPAMTRVRG